jgi:hypothetical protein
MPYASRPPKSISSATAKRRHPSADVWAALAGAIRRQWDTLPIGHPRRSPSLPRLRCLERRDGERGAL